MAETNALKRDEKGRLMKGTPPGPGRPPGSISIMTKIKQKWEENPEEFEAYVIGILEDKNMHKEIVQQIDGKPKDSLDITSGGEKLQINVVAYGANASAPIPTPQLPA